MSPRVQEITEMVGMLPEADQALAFEIIKKLVLAWDPDFTKSTPDEARRHEIGKQQLANGEYFTDDEIDWDNMENMDLD